MSAAPKFSKPHRPTRNTHSTPLTPIHRISDLETSLVIEKFGGEVIVTDKIEIVGFHLTLIFVCIGFFFALIGSILLGWQFARRSFHPDNFMEGLRGTEAAIFGMMGLLVAFSFYGAASRFDERRHLVVDEANAIGTAYLRLDLLPPSSRVEAKELFKSYLDQRLATYESWLNADERQRNTALSSKTQNKIWKLCIEAVDHGASPQVQIILLPALNAMFDISTTRVMYGKFHPPVVIYILLTVVALLCSAVAGHSMAKEANLNWLHIVGFSLMVAFIFYVILDIEYPRRGFIRITEIDQVLRDLRQSMN